MFLEGTMPNETLVRMFRKCRAAAVPIVGIETSDPAATVQTIRKAMNGESANACVVAWDIAQAAIGLSAVGQAWINKVCGGAPPQQVMGRPTDFMSLLGTMPGPRDNEDTTPPAVAIMYGASRLLDLAPNAPEIVQAIWNQRDVFKATGATLILLGPLGWQPPVDLVNDIVMLEDPLPTIDELKEVVRFTAKQAGFTPSDEVVTRAAEALVGVNSYAAENAVALAITDGGIDVKSLWDSKRKIIETTQGLTYWKGTETLADYAGNANFIGFLRRLFSGSRRPRIVVLLDEVEKAFAGTGTETSGVTTRMSGTFLSWTEDSSVSGFLLVGLAGAGKTAAVKAICGEFGIPLLILDIGALMGSLVGQSEANLRNVIQVIMAIAGGGEVLIMGTCNSVAGLSSAMRRRFRLGTFFFELPDRNERGGIWNVYRPKYPNVDFSKLPEDEGWTGAEIRNCVDVADRLEVSLAEAATYIVPTSASGGEEIAAARRQASGRFLSASYAGIYQMPDMVPAQGVTGRRIGGLS